MSKEESTPNRSPESNHQSLNFLAPYALLSVAELAALELSGAWELFTNGGFASCLIVFLAAANVGLASRAAGLIEHRL